MKVSFEDLPKFQPSEDMKLGETVLAEGIIDIQRRRMEDRDILLSLEDYVGGFKRENGWSNLSYIESSLAHLNGCKVRVTLEILEFPSVESDSEVDDNE